MRPALRLVLSCVSASWPALALADEPLPETSVYDEEPIEVTVREPPKPAETTTFTRAETRLLPGAFGDPFRAVEAAPGVVPLVSGVPYFYVRGAPPGNVGYVLDGIRVPLLFHLGLGPSVIHPALIDRVELSPGSTPEVGRYAAGVVSGTLTAPREELRVEGNLRVVDTGAFLEVPFDEGRGQAMAAGRFSYTAALFSLINSSTVLNYWDYAGRFSYEVAPGHRLGVFGFGAYDYLGEKQETGPDKLMVDTGFHRLDFFYDVDLGRGSKLSHDVVLGWDQTHLDEGREVLDQSLSIRSLLEHSLGELGQVRTGVEVSFDRYDVDLDRGEDEGFTSFFSSRTDLAAGAFVTLPLNVGRVWSVLPGLRADLFASDGESAFSLDPSVSSKVQILRWLALTASAGLVSQPPSFIVAGPGFRPGLDQGGLQRIFTSSAGLEVSPGDYWTLRGTVYRLTMFDLNDALGTSALAGEGFPEGFEDFDQRFRGTSTGLELSASRRLSRTIGAAISYTLGRSQRSDRAGRQFPSGFDRTHVLSAALSFDFTKGFRGGIKQLLYSGAPQLELSEGEVSVRTRLPPFYRLDWRAEKRWDLGKRGHISLVAEVLNTFLAAETVGESCAADRCSPTRLGPVTIPSLGVEGGY